MDQDVKSKIQKKELSKLNKIFRDIPEEKKKLTESLKQQAAFMAATLAELQEIINQDGAVEHFINGSQQMLREHPATKSYNALIRNYNATIKALLDLLPKGAPKDGPDDFDAFINGS